MTTSSKVANLRTLFEETPCKEKKICIISFQIYNHPIFLEFKNKIIHISERWATTVVVLKSKPRVLGKWARVPHQIWAPVHLQDHVRHLHLQKPDFTKIKPIFCPQNLGPNNLRILCILFPGFSFEDSGYQSWKKSFKTLTDFLNLKGHPSLGSVGYWCRWSFIFFKMSSISAWSRPGRSRSGRNVCPEILSITLIVLKWVRVTNFKLQVGI